MTLDLRQQIETFVREYVDENCRDGAAAELERLVAQARREALEDAIVMLRPLRKFAVSVMTVEEKAAAFDELCAASAPPALAAEHPWIGSMSDAPQPDEPDEHDLERMDADAFTRAAASVPKE